MTTCQLLTLVSRYSLNKYLTALMYSVPKWNVLLTPLMMPRSTVFSLPELNSSETAPETSSLCVKLFQEMGAEVSLLDIEIAHRVSTRNEREGSEPVVCKFVRCSAKRKVMEVLKHASEVIPTSIGLSAETSLGEQESSIILPRRNRTWLDFRIPRHCH